MKRLGFLVICLLLTIGNGQALKVYLLSYHNNVGDHNVVRGIGRALTRLSDVTPDDIDVKAEGPLKIKERVDADLKKEQVVVIGTGEGGLTGVKDLPQNPNLFIGLTSHVPLPGFEDLTLLQKVRFIALPIHTTGKETQKLGNKVFVTTGVAHNRTVEDAKDTYAEWESELPPAESYLGVVLGGDVTSPSKETKLFTLADAERLANYVTKNADGACVLVLNGPRTGKHDDEKREIASAHRSGQTDHVTKMFITSLTSKLGTSRVKLFNFQHDQELPYNSFDLAMGAVMAKKGKMLIPGESTSMVSEAVDTLPPGQVIVYCNSAMNDMHHAHVNTELAAKRISYLRSDNTLTTTSLADQEARISAADAIAKHLWELVTHS